MLKVLSPRCFLATVICALAVPSVAGAATITVTTAGDGASGCTLRGAIAAANANADQHGCTAGGAYGDDTIQVPAGIGPTLQVATGNDLEPGGSGTLTINGPGAGSLDVRAATGNHVFVVNGTGAVTISGMTISHATFNDSSATTRQGGGVYVSPGANLTLDHVTVTGNSTTVTSASGFPQAQGGGIFSVGTLTIRDSTVSGNAVHANVTAGNPGDQPFALGGGVDQAANTPLLIERSTISGNTATASAVGAGTTAGAQAGGIQIAAGASNTAVIRLTTISGNQVVAANISHAGGLYTAAPNGTTLEGDTITDNQATTGANAEISHATTENTIVSDPQGGPNCQNNGQNSSAGYNLEDGNSCGFNKPSDHTNVASTGLDPSLADNGGPTQTHALLAGSPAIDQGNSFGETTDQRGLTRPADLASVANAAGGDGADIGAYEVQGHNLSVSTSGSGTVTSSPAGISCGPTCQHMFDAGSSVTLTATPTTGARFAGWSGGGCSGTGTCTVTMNSDVSVTATFVAQNVLTVSKAGSGQGNVASDVAGISCGSTCAWAYDTGAAVTLTATPAAGSRFDGWSGGGCSGTGTCTVLLAADTSVTATFGPAQTATIKHKLTVARAGTGQGTVSSTPVGISCGSNCQQSYDERSGVTLTATPMTGSKFIGWGGACSGIGSCNVTMSSDKSVTASFALIPAIAGLHLSPAKFVRDGRQVRGKCVAASRSNAGRRHCTRAIAIVFDYRLNVSSRVTFTIQRALDGRLVKGRCVAPTSSNARARHCTRLTPVGGSTVRNDGPGTVRFTFDGRIGSTRLGAGSYRLTATPSSSGQTGKSQTVSFQIA